MEIYSDSKRLLRAVTSKPDREINLAEAALAIAASEYPKLDVRSYLEQLDNMAGVVSERLSSGASLSTVISQMNRFLFEEQGFVGNTVAYYDPRNSFLNEVLERKMGIPITLSLVYLEIGQRLGLPFAGVMFPGHFLVKLNIHGGDIVLDPYAGGRSLSKEKLNVRLSRVCRRDDLDLSRLLASARKKDTLVRLLRNLKGIYIGSGEYHKALNTIQHILIIKPDSRKEIRDRGYVYEKLECFRAASEDYQRYLALAVDARDKDVVRKHLVEMQRACEKLH